jgi:peptidoglycan/LPS O-acetylase OafA/YrhL
MLWPIAPLGSRAVDVFFVLSGLLISASVAGKTFDAKRYAIARLARIYSVAIPALIFAAAAYALLSALGRQDAFYAPQPWFETLRQIACNAVFAAQFWNTDIDLRVDGPYWSLCFEVIYYAAFGLLVSRWRYRWLGVALLALAAGPRVMVYFPLWLLGVATRRLMYADRLSARSGAGLAGVAAAALLGLLPYFIRHFHGFHYEALTHAPTRLLSVCDSAVTGLLFSALLLGGHAARSLLRGQLLLLRRPAAWLAGRSFAFYLFHVPLLALVVGLLPWPAAEMKTQLVTLIAVPLGVLLLAEISEQRKAWWVRLFGRMLR